MSFEETYQMGHTSVTKPLLELIVSVFFFLHQSGEKSFTLPVLARATPATGVVPVQEQLVWGSCRAGVWHRDYRWCSGWGKLRFSCWISEKSIVSFTFSEVELDWIICRWEEVSKSPDCYWELYLSCTAVWIGLGVKDMHSHMCYAFSKCVKLFEDKALE